jgi:hypothetical protein
MAPDDAVTVVAPLTPTAGVIALPILARETDVPEAVNAARAVDDPMAPKTVAELPADKVKLCAPSTVLDNVIVPEPLLLSIATVLFVNVMALRKEMDPFVVMLAPMLLSPVPFCVKEPPTVKGAPELMVNVSLLVIVTGPDPVVVLTAPWNE